MSYSKALHFKNSAYQAHFAQGITIIPELHPDSALSMWPDNRIARDAHYLYRYDRHGRLTEKTDLIPEGVIRTDDERTHRYHYDSQHRLVHYTRTQYAEPLVESRYLYDPLGRRVAKRVWRRERDLTGWMSLSSSMMRSPACITTATAIMTRCRGGISLRIRLG